MELAGVWYEAAYAGGSAKAYRTSVAAYTQKYGLAATGASRQGSILEAAPPSHSLPVEHRAQSVSYYCGPASGFMILKYRGNMTSEKNGDSLSQGSLAKYVHMDTDNLKSTPWDEHRFRIGLNRWRTGVATGFFVDLDSPSGSDVQVALTYDLYQKDIPFGADTVEFAGGVHYNGHPNQTIGHWPAAYGYANSGDTAYFLDPSTSVWSGVNERFNYNTDNFTNRFLQSNGITW